MHLRLKRECQRNVHDYWTNDVPLCHISHSGEISENCEVFVSSYFKAFTNYDIHVHV